MSETVLEVNGHKYSIGKLSAFDQFHVGRRLAPIFTRLGAGMFALARGEQQLADPDFVTLLPPIMDAVQHMSDDDSDFILHKCLGVVKRLVGDKGIPILPAPKVFQFEDITMPTMIRLTIEVVRENMGDFFPGLRELTESPSS